MSATIHIPVNDGTAGDFEVMTNYDLTINEDAEQHLAQGGIGCHPALGHWGIVWAEHGQYHEQVWVFGRPVDVVSASTLGDLMDIVNERWGDA